MIPNQGHRVRDFVFILLGSFAFFQAYGAVSLHAAGPVVEPGDGRSAVKRGVDWLLSQQGEDGRWCSETYGVLRSGVGTTALIVDALSETKPAADSPTDIAIRRGIKALTSNLSPEGLVLAPDGRSDSPVYGTALILTASQRVHPLPEELRTKLINGLLRSQQIPANGWPENAPGRGGWGTEPDPATADSNPSNLSVTVYVLRALAETNALKPAVRADATSFLNRVRNANREPDGGFWFHPRRNDHLNKLGWFLDKDGQPQPRSYSTATCDGLSALLQVGFSDETKDVQAAMTALLSQQIPSPPELPTEPDGIIPPLAGLYFYHAAALATVWSETKDERLKGRCQQVRKQLISLQKEDGRWESPIAIMREDDSLIATAFALIALQLTQ